MGFIFISAFASCKKEKEKVSAASEKNIVEEPEFKEYYRAMLKMDSISWILNIK